MLEELTPEAKRKIDAYLDAVEDTLRSHDKNRDERQAIVDSLADQINEMLDAETSKGESTLTQVDNVLARLDSPQAYAQASIDLPISAYRPAAKAGATKPRVSFWSWAGLALAACPMVTVLTLSFFLFVFPAKNKTTMTIQSPDDSTPQVVATVHRGASLNYSFSIMLILAAIPSIPGMLAPILTTAFGIVALGKLRTEPQRYTGWGLALFNTLLFPFLLMSIAAWATFYGIMLTMVYYQIGNIHLYQLPHITYLACGPAVATSGYITFLIARRMFSARPVSPPHLDVQPAMA